MGRSAAWQVAAGKSCPPGTLYSVLCACVPGDTGRGSDLTPRGKPVVHDAPRMNFRVFAQEEQRL